MTNINISGLPALAWQIGFIVLVSLPVWFAAKVTGAGNATLLRSIIALMLGAFGGVAVFFAVGAWGLILVPLVFLISFKYVLDTSFFGAVILGVISLAGYFAMAHFIGGGISFSS